MKRVIWLRDSIEYYYKHNIIQPSLYTYKTDFVRTYKVLISLGYEKYIFILKQRCYNDLLAFFLFAGRIIESS